MQYIRASNEWRGQYLLLIYRFFYSYPWTLAFLILAIAVAIGVYRVEQIYSDYIDNRINELIEQHIQDELRQNSPE